MFTHFYCLIETEGLVRVTSSHVLSRKSRNISESVQDRDVVTTDH